MRYNVAQLLKEPSGHIRQHTLHEDISQLDPDIKPLTTLDGSAQMIRTADGVLVMAKLHTSLELTCGRCLEEFSLPLQFQLEEEFRPTIDIIELAVAQSFIPVLAAIGAQPQASRSANWFLRKVE